MRRTSKLLSIFVTVAILGGLVFAVPAAGIDLGGVLKGGAVVLLVDKFADQLNSTINKLTLNKGVGVEDRTKVVPILSVGQGTYLGAAQVSGPAQLVEKVKAVAALETNFSGRTFRITALVPIESKDVIKDLKRVSGVGVSAIIDVRL